MLLAYIALQSPHLAAEHFYQKKDIAESDTLIEQFGVRIPVLEHQSSGSQLDWPFTLQDIQNFVVSC